MVLVCSICQDVLAKNQDNDDTIVAGSCGHTFHQSCLNHWLRIGAKVCPCCRGNTVLSTISLNPRTSNHVVRAEDWEKNLELKATLENLSTHLDELEEHLRTNNSVITSKTKELPRLEEAKLKLTNTNKVWLERTKKLEKFKTLFADLKVKQQKLESLLSSYKSVASIATSKQANTFIVSTNDCCQRNLLELTERNKLLSRKTQALNDEYNDLMGKHEKLKISYADVSIQIQEYSRNYP